MTAARVAKALLVAGLVLFVAWAVIVVVGFVTAGLWGMPWLSKAS